MNVIIAVTKPCHHCPIIERELNAMDINYEVKYLEDNPELSGKFNIRNSPNLIVDDKLIFQGMPGLVELREFFRNRRAQS